jgi:hypothetical protein
VIISIPAIVPVLNGTLTSALKISGSIQHHKAVLAGRILSQSWTANFRERMIRLPRAQRGD